MPPKAQTNVLRGRGRPKRPAASELAQSPALAAVADAPKKRGRAVKAEAVQVSAETPKKRGRPAKASLEEPVKRMRRSLAAPEPGVEAAPSPKKRAGRPPKNSVAQAAVPAPAPKKRVGRPSLADIAARAAQDTAQTPRRRGRPTKNASADVLSRVAGSPRITKSRAKSTPKAKSAPVPRVNSHMRSKLRTRPAPALNATEKVAPQPAKRRGRPPKVAAQAPSPKEAASRKGPKVAVTKAAVTKPAAPRKKRGITVLEVPDKFATLVKQYLQDLQDADAGPAPGHDGAAEDIVVEAEIDADADAAAAAAAAAEEEFPVLIEENILITSATATTGDDENALITGEQIQVQDVDDADPHANADIVEEDKVMDEIVQDIVDCGDKGLEEDPTEAATEVEIEMSMQEVVQIEQSSNDTAALEDNLDEIVETHEDNPASIFDDDTDSYIHESFSRPSVGSIFA